MSQDKIWDYFQNEGIDSFSQATPRYKYIADRVEKSASATLRVLNIGVGNGGLERELLTKKIDVTSIDPNESAIERLKELGVDGHVGVIQSLPFEDSSFDCITISEVLEHLKQDDLLQGLKEIRRVLKRDGLIIGTVPFHEKLEDNATVCPHCGEHFHRWGHEQSFDKKKLSVLLESEFTLLHISCRTFVPWSAHPMRILKSTFKYLLGRLGEPIASPSLYFECRK